MCHLKKPADCRQTPTTKTGVRDQVNNADSGSCLNMTVPMNDIFCKLMFALHALCLASSSLSNTRLSATRRPCKTPTLFCNWMSWLCHHSLLVEGPAQTNYVGWDIFLTTSNTLSSVNRHWFDSNLVFMANLFFFFFRANEPPFLKTPVIKASFKNWIWWNRDLPLTGKKRFSCESEAGC